MILIKLYGIQNNNDFSQINNNFMLLDSNSQYIGSLPPCIPISNKLQAIPLLKISIDKIKYLNTMAQISSKKGEEDNSFGAVKYIYWKWWGQNIGEYSDNKCVTMSRQFLYLISVSKSMFLRYCFDMKILEMEMRDTNKKKMFSIFVNFMIIEKMWKGEQISVTGQIKKNNQIGKGLIKIGEVTMRMQIIENVPNPLFQLKQTKEMMDHKNNYSQTDKHKKEEISEKQKKKTVPKYQKYRIDTPINNSSDHESQRQISERRKENIKSKAPQTTKSQIQRISSSCICNNLNPSKYELQKLAILHESDRVLASQKERGQPISIQVQFLYLQSMNQGSKHPRVRIELPVLQDNKIICNEYAFQNGQGTINININTLKNNKQVLQEYLRNSLTINLDNLLKNSLLRGSIQMSKIMNSVGQVLAIPLISKTENRKSVQQIYGHYFIQINQRYRNTQSDQNKKKGSQIHQNQSTNIHLPILQYLWLFMRQIHFLQPQYYQQANLFIKVLIHPLQSQISTHYNQTSLSQNEQIMTKVIWKCSSPIFNELTTFNYYKNQNSLNHVSIIVFNKVKEDYAVGMVSLEQLENILRKRKQQYMGEIQLPIIDVRGVVLGYLGVCFGRGNLTQATMFLRTHQQIMGKQNKQKQNRFNEGNIDNLPEKGGKKNQQNQQNGQNEQMELKSQSNQRKISENSQRSSLSIESIHPIQPKRPRQENIESLPEIHCLFFCKMYKQGLSDENWLVNEKYSKTAFVKIDEFDALIDDRLSSLQKAKLSSFYFDKNTKKVDLEALRQSFQAFLVYYESLLLERDEALQSFIHSLQNYGLSINAIQQLVNLCPNKPYSRPSQTLWANLKNIMIRNCNQTRQQLSNMELLIEQLRYFYEGKSIEDLCDELRRYEVFGNVTTSIPIQLYQYQIRKQLCEILNIENVIGNQMITDRKIRQEVRNMGVQLSKWEQLIIFGEEPNSNDNKPYKMVKSPTFGVLGTDRLVRSPPKQQYNPSIAYGMQHPWDQQLNSSEDFSHSKQITNSLKIQSQSFFKGDHFLKNNPISPINRENQPKSNLMNQASLLSQEFDSTKTIKNLTILKLSNLQTQVQEIFINGKHYDLILPDPTAKNHEFCLDIPKVRNYEGVLIFNDGAQIQFEGDLEEWISLIDEEQVYRGCIQFS